jgi:tetratricopeptide (TPR) repeat protein
MGAFLIRFPWVRINMIWFWGFFRVTRFSAAAYWLLPVWFAMEIFSGLIFGSSGGVAHMAHVGGFAFGMLAALAINRSGLEHVISRAIDEEVDPDHDSDLVLIHELVAENRLDDAIADLDRFLATNPDSEPAMQLQQELYWRKGNIPAYAQAMQKLCALHLTQRATDQALKDYEQLVQSGGGLLPADTWFKLCQALEKEKEYERALGEYQELAEAYPNDRQALMALMAAARLANNKVNRPQHAINLYQAAAESTIPHLDLDASIQLGIKNARAALSAPPTSSPAAATATAG